MKAGSNHNHRPECEHPLELGIAACARLGDTFSSAARRCAPMPPEVVARDQIVLSCLGIRARAAGGGLRSRRYAARLRAWCSDTFAWRCRSLLAAQTSARPESALRSCVGGRHSHRLRRTPESQALGVAVGEPQAIPQSVSASLGSAVFCGGASLGTQGHYPAPSRTSRPAVLAHWRASSSESRLNSELDSSQATCAPIRSSTPQMLSSAAEHSSGRRCGNSRPLFIAPAHQQECSA